MDLFMSWFYENYIRPQLDEQVNTDPIAFTFSCLENSLEPNIFPEYRKVKEFWAVHAFLIGLRLGQELSDASFPLNRCAHIPL